MLVAGDPMLERTLDLPVDVREADLEETVIDPLCDRSWDSLIASHPDCTFFHSTAWARTVCKAYGHRAIYCCYKLGEKIVALIPVIELKSALTGCRGVCLPFSDYCAPLIFDEGSAELVREKLL